MSNKTYEEFILNESSGNLGKFYREFGRYYRSGRKYSFKEWLGIMSNLYDILD